MTAKARLGLDELELGSWRANGENTTWLLVTIVAVVLPHMSRLPISKKHPPSLSKVNDDGMKLP